MACACAIATPAKPNASLDVEEEPLRSVATTIELDKLRTTFLVPDMHCIACVRRIESSVAELDFVEHVRANLTQKTVLVDWQSSAGSARQLADTIESEGFSCTVLQAGDRASDKNGKPYERLLSCVAVSGFAAANVMLLSVSVGSGASGETRDLFHLISGIIAVPAAAYAGRPFFASAVAALRNWRLNMDVPISLAIVPALVMSVVESLRGGEEAYFDAALMLLFFLLIGRTLDALMRDRARSAVEKLSKMAAKGAVRLSEGGLREYVDVGELQPGDRVFLAAGERVPTDGIVFSEHGELDRSLVTGESRPVEVGLGDIVEAGTLNMAGPMEIEVKKTVDQSFLGEVAAMMVAAEKGRSKFIRLADRVAGYYAPTVHLLALIAFIGWMVMSAGDWQVSLYTAIAVLIITCPCALGLAVPIVHVIAGGELFSRGVLVKDGGALERISEIDTIVFDKTDMLARGTPDVVRAGIATGDLGVVAALARTSRHPAAQAISRFVENESVDPAEVDDIRELAGLGLEATWNGQRVRLGRCDWVAEIAATHLKDPKRSSHTKIGFAIAGQDIAVVELADMLRPNANSSINKLRKEKLELRILSGDSEPVVSSVAHELAISSYKYGQTPADKIAELERLASAGRRVLMIGDGLNDGPAPAASHVSMAPCSGSDVGRQAADFVFTTQHLEPVLYTWQVARKANAIAYQNITLAICYNCIAVPLAMAGFVTPLVAAIAMSASSILVVANSMRLYGFQARGRDQHRQNAKHDMEPRKDPVEVTPELEAAA